MLARHPHPGHPWTRGDRRQVHNAPSRRCCYHQTQRHRRHQPTLTGIAHDHRRLRHQGSRRNPEPRL
jgi:hypothetical protein